MANVINLPARWIRGCFSGNGSERTAALQALKAAAAAMGAWLVAAVLFHLPQPYLAPYAAVFRVEATVYRSLWPAAQQTAAVLGGVLLAASAVQVVPSQALALGIVVATGLLVGRWRGFGSSDIWVAVTALLLVGNGTAGQSELLLDRILESVLGAAMGLAVNCLVFPPLYPRDTNTALVDELSGLLRDMAQDFRSEGVTDRSRTWMRRIDKADRLAREAESSTAWARESARFNLRRSSVTTTSGVRRRLLSTGCDTRQHLRALVHAIHTTTEQRTPFAYPVSTVRSRLADLFDASADLIGGHDTGTARENGYAALKDLERFVAETDRSRSAALGGVLLPARKVFDQLDSFAGSGERATSRG